MTTDARLASLIDRVASQLPASVAVGGSLTADPATLHPTEFACIHRAIPSRQREFAGGRAAARMALRQLGISDPTVISGPDRAPVWPPGVRGSITHSGDLCLCVATRDPTVAGLGIDLEEDLPLPPDIFDEVLLLSERGYPGRVVFSAKEAVFKALYPTVGFVFGFDAVELALSAGRFTARSRLPLGPVAPGFVMQGRVSRADGWVLTSLAV